MDVRELQRVLRGRIFTDDEALEQVESDFGRVVRKLPAAVVVPADEQDVQRTVRFAYDHHLPLSVRGAGHSQGGQTLNQAGLLLDTGGLNQIGAIEKESIQVQAGALWTQVVARTLEAGLAPPVLTDCLEVTLAGSISTGGLGASSHLFGAQADHVIELEVVTGEGHRVRCSDKENQELFNVVRAGLGQFGVITGVRLRLRPALPRVRTFYLLYDDLSALMLDAEQWLESGRFDYVECRCAPCPQGFRKFGETRLPFVEWFYSVHLSVEHQGRSDPDVSPPAALRCYRTLGYDDFSAEEFVTRSEILFDHWRRAGSWRLAHPGMAVFLPWDKAAAYVPGVLRSFPADFLEAGQVLLRPFRPGPSPAPLLCLPEGSAVMAFSLQPAVGRRFLPRVLPMLAKACELSRQIGGRRYLTGWVDFDHHGWKSHFGRLWPRLLEWKRFHDPRGILNPGFIQFSEDEE